MMTAQPVGSGLYSAAGTGSCRSCTAGHHECSDASISPQTCAAGTYSPGGAVTGCTACAAGTYSGAAADHCEACPGGFSCTDPSAAPAACRSGYCAVYGTTIALHSLSGRFLLHSHCFNSRGLSSWHLCSSWVFQLHLLPCWFRMCGPCFLSSCVCRW